MLIISQRKLNLKQSPKVTVESRYIHKYLFYFKYAVKKINTIVPIAKT